MPTTEEFTVKVYLPDGKKIQHFTASSHRNALERIHPPEGYAGALKVRIEDVNGSDCWICISGKEDGDDVEN